MQQAERRSAAVAPAPATPLVELQAAPPLPPGVRLFAKLESVHPGGSIKDRSVTRIITRALADGRLRGRRLLDSTSGNAGIAYALYGAVLGVPVTLVMPGNASRERLERIRAHGAEVIETDPLEGYDHAVREARRLAAAAPERYWFADQYGNDENWRAHHETTGPEILRQLAAAGAGPPDLFVAGVGTGGTITGIGRRLREVAPDVRIVAVIPEPFPGIEGLKPLGEPGDIVPAILDESLIDERVRLPHERAVTGCAGLAAQGLFVGPSSGAFASVATDLARRGGARTIVTVLSDTGERYGSTGLWGAAVG